MFKFLKNYVMSCLTRIDAILSNRIRPAWRRLTGLYETSLDLPSFVWCELTGLLKTSKQEKRGINFIRCLSGTDQQNFLKESTKVRNSYRVSITSNQAAKKNYIRSKNNNKIVGKWDCWVCQILKFCFKKAEFSDFKG